ncbi:uncharacterized protein LOC130048025 [Ostrea edulis]|uniref:uncharacterized protein LOC130048025 n=1 Tax=Ostrea edulis TaxID=37623 RepID=UPI0024AE950A|nr:uncharacterized protein LOC130048025 [Ostrea edulis]
MEVHISLNKNAGHPGKTKRIRPDEDAKVWCPAGLDKDGFEKRFINETIGFGVFTTKFFENGIFLLVYIVDATDVTERMCHYVNDDKRANITMKLKVFNKYPRLYLFALRDINEREEIRYDYGDDNAPWQQHLHNTKMEMDITEVVEDDDPFDLKKPKKSEKKVRNKRVEEGGKHQDSPSSQIKVLLLSEKMSKHDEKIGNSAIVSLTEANVQDYACSGEMSKQGQDVAVNDCDTSYNAKVGDTLLQFQNVLPLILEVKKVSESEKSCGSIESEKYPMLSGKKEKDISF